MKTQVQPQDVPKVVGLVIAVVLVIGYIAVTLSNSLGGDSSAKAPVRAEPMVQVAAKAAPNEDPMAYIRTIERYSAPPTAPAGGDPFRSVVPRANSTGARSSGPRPISEFGPLNPMTPGSVPGIQIGDYPEVHVHGVLVDYSQGSEATYAVLGVGGKTMYLKPGDKLQDDVTVTRVSEAGVWIRAGKENAFIEVSRTYRPHGMPGKA